MNKEVGEKTIRTTWELLIPSQQSACLGSDLLHRNSVWNVPPDSGFVPPGDRARLALCRNSLVKANNSDLIYLMAGAQKSNC